MFIGYNLFISWHIYFILTNNVHWHATLWPSNGRVCIVLRNIHLCWKIMRKIQKSGFNAESAFSSCLAYVKHPWIHSWNQPVLSNEGKVSCSRKQWEPLIGLELMTDRHPPITSQTRYPFAQRRPFKEWFNLTSNMMCYTQTLL